MIQLAFQGGGAKFVAMLAVAEAVQDLQKEGVLKVGRVSGTSAGAIVAAILAAGVDIQVLRNDLLSKDGRLLLNAFRKISKVEAIGRAFFGMPFWNTDCLREWLTSIFTEKPKVEQLVRDPKKRVQYIGDCEAITDLTVMASNLGDWGMQPYQKNHLLVAALMDSTALPFCFRTWRTNGNNLILDGGLGENLPISQLSTQVADYGEMVAVTFARTPPKPPKDAKTFAMALLSFAIDASVARACATVEKDRVLEVPTTIETLDFERALGVGLKEEYTDIYKWAQKRVIMLTAPKAKRELIDPWSVNEPAMKTMMDDLALMYEKTHAHRGLAYEDVVFEVTSFCLRTENTQVDRLACKMKFAPTDSTVSCHAISLAGFGERDYHGRIAPKLRKATGEQIKCRIVPTFTSGTRIGDDERQVLLFFDEWLEPGKGPYELRIRDEARDIMWPLKKHRKDEVGITLPRACGRIKRVVVALHVPQGWGDISVTQMIPSGRELSETDQAEFDPLPDGFRTIGAVFENAEADQFLVKFGPALK